MSNKIQGRSITIGNMAFADTYDKGRTTDYCTVYSICRAPFLVTHDEPTLGRAPNLTHGKQF
jgi:hypothetical protein